MSLSAIAYLDGLGAISDTIDLVIMDLWGCMHDGINVYPAALNTLHQLKAKGIPVALVSNAPRRTEIIRPRLRQLGITDDLYAGIYTSGEMIWQHLSTRYDPAYGKLGRRAYAIVADHDRSFFDGLDVTPTEDIADADFILAIGVENEHVTVMDFDPVLKKALARGLTLICANPDLMVHRGGIAEICAGAIADEYQRLGGDVLIEGKPYPGIYRRVIADFAIKDVTRVIGVGDALRTDVAGAAGIGAKSLFIAGGIHQGDLLREGRIDREVLDHLSAQGPRPSYALPYLAW
ncbi:TIGR01459 family HAD-type hydrolase [Dongia sp.]|uniref:TIGR01459 family HAD-type hydrolase n=1 Tax=Dongia sp. TaxID=1977262 RepID=UPI0035AE88B2